MEGCKVLDLWIVFRVVLAFNSQTMTGGFFLCRGGGWGAKLSGANYGVFIRPQVLFLPWRWNLISERFWQFYFFTSFCIHFRRTKCKIVSFFVYPCRLGKKLRKGTFFEKKVRYFQLSSDWYFDVNTVRSSSISHFTKRCFKAQKGTFFAVGSDVLKSDKKGTFLAVGSDVLKSTKKVTLIVFSSHGKPFRNLLIDRCQPFGVIFMNFLSEFTNPLVKR